VTTVRAFIAIPVGEEVSLRLGRLVEKLRSSGARVSWARTDNIHLTLVFLGDVKDSVTEPLARSMDEVVAHVSPFKLKVEGLDSFGRGRYPRVIWAGVTGDTRPLARIQSRLADAAMDEGIEVDERPYRPHLTLGRVKGPRNRDELARIMDGHRADKMGTVTVDRLVLMQSRLEPTGAVHTPLHVCRFAGSEGDADDGGA